MSSVSESLAVYACRPVDSRGRAHPEDEDPTRTAYQRDRDRIIHCAAFRRLEYKTQVFVNHEGDLFRTRLTHTLEVSQIARSIARALRLNEDLVEAITLAHDLGHPPFGHAGQDALNECMAEYGGFEHNLQALRIVDRLEERYAEFDGLNLCFETREGILKHCGRRDAEALGDVGRRFLEDTQPGLEAQLANIADEIAYVCHDVDDSLRAGLIDLSSLSEIAVFDEQHQVVTEKYPELNERRMTHEIIRRMTNALIVDVIDATAGRLAAAKPGCPDDARKHGEVLVGYSQQGAARVRDLKSFLYRLVYRHYRVQRMSAKARRIIRDLFDAFCAQPVLLPPAEHARVRSGEGSEGRTGRARVVADYIAGMTDRYASLEYRRLFDPMVRA